MERLKILRAEKGYSQAQLAKILDTSQANISGWERGAWQPDNDNLKRIAALFNVSVDYLLSASDERTETKKSPVIENEVEFNDRYAIPLLGQVVAGIPLESQENLEGYIYVSYKPKENYFALRVHGDSMINVGIRDKSVLIVHKQSYAENGDIVVALINGESTVKRFKVYGDTMFLMPENPTFEPIPVLKGADFLILGKVVEVRISL